VSSNFRKTIFQINIGFGITLDNKLVTIFDVFVNVENQLEKHNLRTRDQHSEIQNKVKTFEKSSVIPKPIFIWKIV
jgi:hypothetical protein